MNTSKQFWPIFKLQLMANPNIWFMALAFSMPLFIGLTSSTHDFEFVISSPNLFFGGLMGVLIFAPEILTPSSQNSWTGFGMEFILTRAVDRRIVARAKTFFFYLLILSIPAGLLFYSLKEPDLKATSYSKIIHQECLSVLKGSVLTKESHGLPHLLFIPRGNILIAAWHAWEFSVCAILTQTFIYLIHPLKHRKQIFYLFFIGFVITPFVGIYSHQPFSLTDRFFFGFASHPILLWALTIFAFVLCQLWYERRFIRMEH